MSFLEEKLQQWIVNELHPLSEARSASIPQPSALRRLTETEENKEIFNFLVNHVRSRSNAEKMRRILKIKQAEEERERNKFVEFPCQIDTSRLHQEISKANEKVSFLKSSISATTVRVECTVQNIRELGAEIDILKQKSAFLETFICKYREKILLLNSLREQLVAGRFISTKHMKSSQNDTNQRFNYVLGLISSVVKKELKREENVESMFESIGTNVDQKVKTILLTDLIFTLKSLSETAFNNILKDVENFSKIGLTSSDKIRSSSLTHLQNLKMRHVHSVFTTQKIRMETEELKIMKDTMSDEKFKSMFDKKNPDFERRWELFDKMVEIRWREESVKLLGSMLCEEQNNAAALEGKNNLQSSASQDLETVITKFYRDFDFIPLLLKWACDTFGEILKSVSQLHMFANKDVFAGANLEQYPSELQNNLNSAVGIFWSACKRNNIIKSSMYDPLPSTTLMCNAMSMPQFHNAATLVHKIKQVKDEIHEDRSNGFSVDSEKLIDASECYAVMLNAFGEIESKLEDGDVNIGKCPKFFKRITVALNDWWDQEAQYILDLSYDNKTLKMWQDILKLLTNFS